MINKIERHLTDNYLRYIICAMIGFIGIDQLLLHIPTTNLYASVAVVANLMYLAIIGLLRVWGDDKPND